MTNDDELLGQWAADWQSTAEPPEAADRIRHYVATREIKVTIGGCGG